MSRNCKNIVKELSQIEQLQLKEYKKYLRLSSERDLYTIPQAAFRLGISRNEFERAYVKSGLIMLRLRGSEKLVPRTELEKAIEMMQKIVSSYGLSAVGL